MIPPHLPKPVCNIKSHTRWVNIRNIAVVALFGLFAGICGGAMAVGWIWPMFGGGDTWVVSQNRTETFRNALEDVVYKDSSEKIFSVYKDVSRVDSLTYFAAKDKVGEAVAISSDGWLVMYLTGKAPIFNAARWQALSYGGDTYSAEKFLFDSYAKIAYIKISPAGKKGASSTMTQFRVAGFEENPTPYNDVYIHNDSGWRYTRLGFIKPIAVQTARLDSAPGFDYSLEGTFTPGSVAINSRGRVVGFVGESGNLLPGYYVTRVMPSVLSRQAVEYPSFGVIGWLSSGQPAVADGSQIMGFVVSDVWNSKSKLRRGDVIVEVNGQIVRDESLWYNISGLNVTLTVFRSGKIFDLPVELFRATPGSI